MQTVNYSDYIYYAGTTQPVVRVPVYVYEANTENLASLYDGSGDAIDNPTQTDDNGLFDFWTTFGKYDIYVHNTKEYSVSLLNLAYFYLGVYDANPTERPDGSDLQDGDMYFNSVINHSKVYNNGLWYYAEDLQSAANVTYDPASGPQTDVQTQMREYDTHLDTIDTHLDTIDTHLDNSVLNENIDIDDDTNVSDLGYTSLTIVDGGSFTIASGKTLTIDVPFKSGLYQVFNGDGSVVFGAGGVTEVHPEWWGAAGGSDSTSAIQKSIDCCLSNVNQFKSLVLSGLYEITSPINIDISIYPDSPLTLGGEFQIIGTSPQAGFYVDSSICMFSATNTSETQAVSGFFSFNNVWFSSSDESLNALVLDEKFINVRFHKCSFLKINCMSTTLVCFGFTFDHCNINSWSGTFFRESWTGSTDVEFIGCYIEGNSTGETVAEIGVAGQGFRFISNTVETTTGSPIRMSGSRGGLISGNYFEACCTTDNDYYIDCAYGSPWPTSGIVISGNMFMITAEQIADSGFYCIDVSGSVGAFLAGNYTNGPQLFTTTTGTTGAIQGFGNVINDTEALRADVAANSFEIIKNAATASNQNVYNIQTDIVVLDYTNSIFSAASTTNNATVWTQPANSVLVGFRALQTARFVASGMTDLDMSVGDSGANSGVWGEAMNLTSAPAGTPFLLRGSYWNGGSAGTEIYEGASSKAWKGYVTATGANLNTLSAGSITLYFTYRNM